MRTSNRTIACLALAAVCAVLLTGCAARDSASQTVDVDLTVLDPVIYSGVVKTYLGQDFNL